MLSCPTNGGVQDKEKNSSFGWYYFCRKAEAFFLFIICTDVLITTIKVSRYMGVFVVLVVVDMEVLVIFWADVRMQLLKRG